jgi:hypothetical protein
MSDTITPEIRQAVITDIAKLAKEKYIVPAMGEEIMKYILAKLEQGGYDNFSDAHEFALALKSDLRHISNDQHWDVMYDASQATVSYGDLEDEDKKAEVARWVEQTRRKNFGFEKIERLVGNIGYIDLRGFILPEYAGETAVAAMNFVANCDALIFDLRKNGGGESEMLVLLLSYLFSPELKHLNTIYSRPTDEYWQFWTLSYVPGKHMPDIPVYVLTSRATFSGAEEFAYDLKYMERATIIGETTGGGGHMVDLAVIQDHFHVLFPFAGAIHPITKSSWEGTGVEPHIAVPQEKALETAHLTALEQLIEKCGDDQRRKDLEWELEIARSLYSPIHVNETTLARYAGQYGQRVFTVVNGKLTYLAPQSIERELTPLNESRFRLNEDVKFEFMLDEQQKVSAVVITYHDDRPEITAARTK